MLNGNLRTEEIYVYIAKDDETSFDPVNYELEKPLPK